MPWRSCRAAPPSAPKATRAFNVLWHGRALLALLLAAWGVSAGRVRALGRPAGRQQQLRRCRLRRPLRSAARPPSFSCPARSSPRCCVSAASGAPTRLSSRMVSPAGRAQGGCAGGLFGRRGLRLCGARGCWDGRSPLLIPSPKLAWPGGRRSACSHSVATLLTLQDLPHRCAGRAAATLCFPGPADADCGPQVRGAIAEFPKPWFVPISACVPLPKLPYLLRVS